MQDISTYINDYIIGTIVCIIKVLLFIYLSNQVSRYAITGNKWQYIYICFFITVYTASIILPFSNIYNWVIPVMFLLLSMLYMCLFCKNYFIENIVISLCYYINWGFINGIIAELFSELQKIFEVNSSTLNNIQLISTIIVAYIIVTRVLVKLLCYKDYYFTNYEFGWLIFFGLVGFFSLIFYQGPSFLLVGAISCVFMLLFSSYIQLMRKKEESKEHLVERNHFLEEQNKLIRAKELEKYESYKKSTETDEQIRRIHHDLMHHFNALLSYKNIEEVREYINKLKGVVTSEESTYETGSIITMHRSKKIDGRFNK